MKRRIDLLSKHKDLLEQLNQWEQIVPSFLHWEKQPNSYSPTWIKMQRAYLQSQYDCIGMKLNCSIAHLEPIMNDRYTKLEEVENPYALAHKAASRVICIAKGSTALNGSASILYHADAIRATKLALQSILRNASLEPTLLEEFIVSCRDGIKTCRSLVPKLLARAEDTCETLLNE